MDFTIVKKKREEVEVGIVFVVFSYFTKVKKRNHCATYISLGAL